MQTPARIEKVAIIGVGSPFGADRLGWDAVDWLERQELSKKFPDLHFEFSQTDRPGALLLEQIRRADAAIILDAMQAGLSPGTLRTFTPDQLSNKTGFTSSHGFGLAESILLGSVLGQLPHFFSIIGIEMGDDMSMASFADPPDDRLLGLVEQMLSSIP